MEGCAYPTKIAASVLQDSEADFATNVSFINMQKSHKNSSL